MHTHAGLAWVFRTWWTRHGRGLLLSGLLGLPLVPLAHGFDGWPAVVCWCGAWTLIGLIPGGRVLGLATLTVEARRRRPSGMPPGRWRALRLAVAGCAGAIGAPWIVASPSLMLLDARFDASRIPVVLVLGAVLGLTIHSIMSAARRR